MNEEAMRKALRESVELLGSGILADRTRFRGVICDLLPGLYYQKERSLLIIAVANLSLGEQLLKAPDSDEAREYVFKYLLKEIMDSGFSQEAAEAVLRSFAFALGWHVEDADKGNGGPNAANGSYDTVQIPPGPGSCAHLNIDFFARRCRICDEKLYGIFDKGGYIAYEKLEKNESGGFLFSLGDYGGTLVLPEHLRGIGDYALSEHENLSEVVFPSSLISIGKFAFERCSSLKNLKLPDSLARIGAFAFAECVSLRSVNLPDALQYIEEGAFSGCSDLELQVPSSVYFKGEDAFAGVKRVEYNRSACTAPWSPEERVRGASPRPAAFNRAGVSGGKTGIAAASIFIVGTLALLFFVFYKPNTSNETAGRPVQSAAEKAARSEKKAADKPAKSSAKSVAGKKFNRRNIASLRAAYADKKAGEHFEFGSYPQEADGKAELITWRVLRRESDALLVIAELGLTAKSYNKSNCDTTWGGCSLRAWLNGEFLKKAFTDQERSLIKVSHLSNNAGPATDDRVFLLSIEEAKSLFANNNDRVTKPTAYAVNNGAYVSDTFNGNAWWWLRSHGDGGGCAAGVSSDGDINCGYYAYYIVGSVRPVIRIAL